MREELGLIVVAGVPPACVSFKMSLPALSARSESELLNMTGFGFSQDA